MRYRCKIELLLVTCLLIGVFRSGLLQTGSPGSASSFARRFTLELMFIGSGLALAHYLGGASIYPEAFAMWGFYLAQSGFFLLGGEAEHDRVRQPPKSRPDGFAAAMKRAREALGTSP